MISTGMVGTAAPGHLAVEREQRAGEDVAARRAAARTGSPRARGACAARRSDRRSSSARSKPSRWRSCRRRRRGRAASRRGRPGCGGDRRRSSPRAPGRRGSPRKWRKSTYSAGMVASASSSKHQWPSRLRSASSASVADAMPRSSSASPSCRRPAVAAMAILSRDANDVTSSCGSPRRAVPVRRCARQASCRRRPRARADRRPRSSPEGRFASSRRRGRGCG